jgi:hypothetical protein
MQAIERLGDQAELLRIRKRAARREGTIFVVILITLLLAAALLIGQTGYEPDVVGLLTTAVMSLGITSLASARMAESRMLRNMLELVDVLQQTIKEDVSPSSAKLHSPNGG